jgi:hypothetical protein
VTVTRATRRFRGTFAAAAVLALAAGCGLSTGSTDVGASATGPSMSPSAGDPTRTTVESEGANPSPPAESSAAVGAGPLEPPATESGPLGQEDFPRPQALGPGWEFSIDPGDAEEGYAGNGTPALARNPREVVQLAVPLGCPRPSKMPVPDHALEVDYTADGTKVVAIRGEFEDRRTAETFFTSRNANLRRCVGRSGGQAIGPLVTTARRLADEVLLSDRTPESAPWTELAVLDGQQVVLVAAQSRLGAPPMTSGQVRRLVEQFHR